MDIEDYIAKLSMEYSKKIEECDHHISSLNIENRLRRRKGASYDDRIDLILQTKEHLARRQAYIQAKVDIESVEDYIDT